MNDDINIIEQQSESGTTQDVTAYIEAIKEMKRSSVARADFERLQAENKELMKALVNGESIEIEQPKAVDVNALSRELFGEDTQLLNLDYVTKSLALRDAAIERGEEDPYVPRGYKFTPSAEDYETAERVASVFRECIDYADGNSELFTQELMRRTIDVAPMLRKPTSNRR